MDNSLSLANTYLSHKRYWQRVEEWLIGFYFSKMIPALFIENTSLGTLTFIFCFTISGLSKKLLNVVTVRPQSFFFYALCLILKKKKDSQLLPEMHSETEKCIFFFSFSQP